MKEKFRKKELYTAPRMQAVSFDVEHGYALSSGTQSFNNVDITFKP